jgi:tetratricopeptide (TPR) repeat protein
MKHLKNPRSWVIASFLVGFVLTMTGWVMWENMTPQTQWYNKGLIAYNTGNYDLAVQNFDRSIGEFNANDSTEPNAFKAPASLEMAELAQLHKFKALLKMKNAKLAVVAIKEGLKLTTSKNLARYKLSEETLKKLAEDRLVAQTDLEILFKQQEQMAQAEGKGNKPGQPKQGEKQAEDPGNQNASGKGNRNSL